VGPLQDSQASSPQTWGRWLLQPRRNGGNLISLGAEASTSSGTYDNAIAIGSNLVYGYGDYFNGTIDEARIYNRALSASEVLELYNYEILNCIDTDVNLTYSDGKNYYLLGNTNVTRNGHLWSSNTDQCPTNTKVKEFFCSNGNFNSIDYDCPTDYSCQSGACIKNINGSACTQNSECGSKSNSLVCYTGNIFLIYIGSSLRFTKFLQSGA